MIVKGGPNAIIYSYSALDEDSTNPAVAPGLPGIPAGGDAAGGRDDADYRPTSPYNPNGKDGKDYGVSHVSFCLDEKAWAAHSAQYRSQLHPWSNDRGRLLCSIVAA